MAPLRECLGSIQQLSTLPEDILVVDNTAGDAGTKHAAEEFGARYVAEPIPGLSRARNRGLAECGSDIVAYLDDDAVPDPAWLEHLLQPFTDPAVGAVTGRVRTPNETPELQGQPGIREVSNRDDHWFEISTFGGLGLGSNMAIRRSACPQGDLFDVRLGRGAPFQIAEECYAFAVLIDLGYHAVYTSEAVVNHPPMRRGTVEEEACNSLAYWLLLFSEFPRHRLDLAKFLVRRLRKKPLPWPRNPQGPGEIISAHWGLKLKSGWAAIVLFLRTPRPPRSLS